MGLGWMGNIVSPFRVEQKSSFAVPPAPVGPAALIAPPEPPPPTYEQILAQDRVRAQDAALAQNNPAPVDVQLPDFSAQTAAPQATQTSPYSSNMTKELIGQINKAAAAEGEALKGQARVEAKSQAALADVYKTQQDELARANAANQEAQAAYVTRRDQLQSELDTRMSDLSKAQIDPERFAKNMALGSKIANVLGTALSGFSLGMRGGNPMDALRPLEEDRQRDIYAQIQTRDGLKALVDQTRGQLGELANNLHTTQDFATANLAMFNKQVESHALQIAAQARSDPNPKNNLLSLQAEQLAAAAKLRATDQIATLSTNAATRAFSYETNPVVRQQEGLAALGLTGTPVGDKQLTDATEAMTSEERTQEAAAELKGILANVGREIFPTKEAERARALSQIIREEQAKRMGITNRPGKERDKLLDPIMSDDPTRLNQGKVLAQIDDILSQARIHADTAISKAGLQRIADQRRMTFFAPTTPTLGPAPQNIAAQQNMPVGNIGINLPNPQATGSINVANRSPFQVGR